MTPDTDTFTSRCTLDVLSFCSVVKSLTVVTRTDRCLRHVNQVVTVRHPVLRQQRVPPTPRHCRQQTHALYCKTARR